MTIYSIDHLAAITQHIQATNKKLIYIAGSSASGKSYAAQLLHDHLTNLGKTVLSLSSDSYYEDQTKLQFLMYGTFDHPHMVEYDLLAQHIHELLTKGEAHIPIYSFKESRRTGTQTVSGKVDYIIIEGLYTIGQLPMTHDPLMIYVDSPAEELVFRRLVRDQERLAETLSTQIINLARVFPMRNVFGAPQKKKADIIINNDYQILSKAGKKTSFELIKESKNGLGKLVSRLYITDYEYNDSTDLNGVIVISEIYKQKHGLLDSVRLSRRNTSLKTNTDSFDSITLELNEPGSLTQLHILLQLAGLKHQRTVRKIESTYEHNGNLMLIKERRGRLYVSR